MAANSFFYSSAYAVSTVIKEEKLLSIYSGIDFLDKYSFLYNDEKSS